MSRLKLLVCFLVMSAGNLLASSALAAVIFASVIGSDGTGDGSFTFPFRTLQHAYAQAQIGDTVKLVEPGDYGPATIDKAITIIGTPGAGIFDPGGNAITVNAGPQDTVTIDNLIIDQGTGTGNGIQVNKVHKLNLYDVSIRTGSGPASAVSFRPNTNAEFYVDRLTTEGFAPIIAEGWGLKLTPRDGAHVTGVLNRVFARNNMNGIVSAPVGSSMVDVTFLNSIFSNTEFAVTSKGAGSNLYLGDTSITGNERGLRRQNGGNIFSVQNNRLFGNTANGSFSGVINVQ